MAGRLSIISDRVDDIPRLRAQLEQMEVRPLLDAYFHAHGHWVGLSLGWVAEGWLTRILVGSPAAAECVGGLLDAHLPGPHPLTRITRLMVTGNRTMVARSVCVMRAVICAGCGTRLLLRRMPGSQIYRMMRCSQSFWL
jgi:hypothetical protein